MIVSAYDKDNVLIEGKLVKSSTGSKMVFHEGQYINVNNLNYVRLVEEENEVDKKVTDDVSHLDAKTLSDSQEDQLKKAGEDREKELKDAGMKMEDGEYSSKFVIQAAAKASAEGGGVDTAKADVNQSKALEPYKVSESIDESPNNGITSNLHSDYQDVMPYEDSKTREQIYIDLNNEITDYNNSTDKFNAEELKEHLCKKFLKGSTNFNTLKEVFNKILSLGK